MNSMTESNYHLYLELMKKSLLASIYDENGWYVLGSLDRKNPRSLRYWIKFAAVKLAWTCGFVIVKPTTGNEISGWGLFCYTMISLARLSNIQFCVEDILKNNVEGDFIETGVWRGGATIFMRAILKANGISDRVVWVADSFEGLPQSKKYDEDITIMNDGGPMRLALAVSLERVKQGFAKFDLLDDQVNFIKGWFRDTLPRAPIEKLALLRLDGDLYDSTMDALNALYGKVTKGGYVIVDDYNRWPQCKEAIDDFRSARGIRDEMVNIDDDAVFWKVSEEPSVDRL
jgi:hypothetical protein